MIDYWLNKIFMKKKLYILLVGILIVLMGVFLFIKGEMLGRIFMILGLIIEIYAISSIIRSYKIVRKP